MSNLVAHTGIRVVLISVLCTIYSRPEKCLHKERVDMYQNDHLLRRFSESFKLKILAELSTGKYSKRELSRLYGVASSTINDWVRKYDRMDLMNTRVIVETKDEISRLRELQKEIEQLKKLLLKKDIEQLMNDSFMEIAAKKLGYKSVQEFKKKTDTSL